MHQTRLILLNRLKSFEGLTGEQIATIQIAMADYADKMVQEHHNRELIGNIVSFVQLMGKLSYDNAILFMRHLALKRTIRKANLRAATERYKVYVLRSSLIGYKALSTRDVDHNKKIKVLGKNITAIELHQKAAYTAYPPKIKRR